MATFLDETWESQRDEIRRAALRRDDLRSFFPAMSWSIRGHVGPHTEANKDGSGWLGPEAMST